MEQEKFQKISNMIFERLKNHKKENTSCILPIGGNPYTIDYIRSRRIIQEVAEEFHIDSDDLDYVLNSLIESKKIIIEPLIVWGKLILR